MNEGLDRKVALGLALTLALLLATGVYWVTEPSRQKGASAKYKLATAEVFAQNCFYCHGDQGHGGVGPPPRATKLDQEGLVKTISRGVIIMPTWAREEGGTLNAFQIQGLADFILSWDEKLMAEALALHPVPRTPNPPPPDIPPPPYAGIEKPSPWGDPKSMEIGQLLFAKTCTECHWVADPQAPSAEVRDAAWAANMEENADYYFWFMSEAPFVCHQGSRMPAFKNFLPEKQRWQVLDYLRNTGTMNCNRGIGYYN